MSEHGHISLVLTALDGGADVNFQQQVQLGRSTHKRDQHKLACIYTGNWRECSPFCCQVWSFKSDTILAGIRSGFRHPGLCKIVHAGDISRL